uniref:Uncharacterized protein n=1 Tax=Quercus lobata TaxID=97700 RepID=A0A7N2KRV2_QUELO
MKHNPVSICSNFKLKSQGDKVHHSTRHIAALQSSGAYHIAEIHINHGSALNVISKGTSISVEKPDILISPNGDFSAGFYSVGDNA